MSHVCVWYRHGVSFDNISFCFLPPETNNIAKGILEPSRRLRGDPQKQRGVRKFRRRPAPETSEEETRREEEDEEKRIDFS